MSSPIRVLIADDEALMRNALKLFVDSAPDMTVVAEAADGEEAVNASVRHRPDVVLMDMQMPGMDGVAATRALLERLPGTHVLAITTFSSQKFLVPALRAGASAYLVKDTEPDALVAAIRDVFDGSCVISPSVTRDLVESVRRTVPTPVDAESTGAENLSEREHDVVRLLGRGLSNAEIAGELFLSEATVKSHLGRVMVKWGVRDRVQVLIHAARTNVIDLS